MASHKCTTLLRIIGCIFLSVGLLHTLTGCHSTTRSNAKMLAASSKRTNTAFSQKGYASWYGRPFHGRRTASGAVYNMYAFTAAHRTLPLKTYVRVTNLENNKQVVVQINDRGPFGIFRRHRIIDLSYAAARALDMHKNGHVRVLVETIPNR